MVKAIDLRSREYAELRNFILISCGRRGRWRALRAERKFIKRILPPRPLSRSHSAAPREFVSCLGGKHPDQAASIATAALQRSIYKRAWFCVFGMAAIDGCSRTQFAMMQITVPNHGYNSANRAFFLDVAKRLGTRQVLDGVGGKPIRRI